MAATDQHYRSQKTLDLIFGLSCGLMLLCTIWMLWQDYARGYKDVQRKFRDIEASIAERDMIDKMPDVAIVVQMRDNLKEARARLQEKIDKVKPDADKLNAQRENADDIARGIKADYDAQMSYFNIAADLVGKEPAASQRHKALEKARDAEKDKLEKLEKRLSAAQAKLAEIDLKIKKEVRAPLAPYEQEVTNADEALKRITATFDRFAKQATRTAWTIGDSVRNLPVLDGFESPTKIRQIWLPDLTIDYSFKDVPRFDRCTSCHLGIDRGNYDRQTLQKLTDAHENARLTGKVRDAQDMLERRVEAGESLGFSPDDLPSERSSSWGLISLIVLLCSVVGALTLGILERSVRLAMYTMTICLLLSAVATAAIGLFYLGATNGYFGQTLKRATKKMRAPVGIKTVDLKEGEVTQYCAHPRLDLFVDSNSPHPMEKFGCTICHSGQGSSTDFLNAVHTPDSVEQEKRWAKQYGWEAQHAGELPPNYHWDFPMLQKRFVESSCLKCHHQVTDLVRHGAKEEAPKLLRGFNLVKEMGCFGCHEIQGQKSGRSVGPDLRLEPAPALDWLSSGDQERVRSDPANPPGQLRKVGPSLRRLDEKVGEEWTRKWIANPRGFRDDTRMPHFYGLSTNTPDALPEGQKKFPDTEINAISYYLLQESRQHLKGQDFYRTSLLGEEAAAAAKKEAAGTAVVRGIWTTQQALAERPLSDREIKDLFDISKRFADLALLSSPMRANSINGLVARQRQLQERAQELQKRRASDEANAKLKAELTTVVAELNDATVRLRDEALTSPIKAEALVGNDGGPVAMPKDQGDADKGRVLFTEKGCLACHAHQGTTGKDAKNNAPGVFSQANFGPELSRIADKLLMGSDATKARTWLVQWLMNPNVYHPRTRMPITHLSPAEANDLATWILAQKGPWKDNEKQDWDKTDPGAKVDLAALREMARMYLTKAPGMTKAEVEAFLPKDSVKGISPERVAMMPRDMDERELASDKMTTPEATEAALKWYVGKKSIGRLGCYGCHDIPGFETAKPIGTGLNDWGKKDHDKLAFEDGEAWAHKHFTIVPTRQTRADVEAKVMALWKRGVEKLDEKKGEEKTDREKAAEWLATIKDVTKLAKDLPKEEAARKDRLAELATQIESLKEKLAAKKDDEKLTGELSRVESERLLFTAEDRLAGAEKATGAELAHLKEMLKADQKRIAELEAKKLKNGLTAKEEKEYKELHELQLFEPTADGKHPMEEMFFQALEHHHREGFLALKLMEPRSYDYNRLKTWDDRLRMPQFKFARSRQKPGESEQAYHARMEADEAEAREAVMTFILGLVAEPVPLKYVNAPKNERAAEVTGRQVLDKYNCAGCHHIRPGVFEFKREDALRQLDLAAGMGGNVSRLLDDFHFPNTNAWVGAMPTSDRLTVFGYLDAAKSAANEENDNPLVRDSVTVRLTDALRYHGSDGLEKNLPAALEVYLPRGKFTETKPYGGTLTDLLSPYLLAKNKTKYPTPQGHLPPPLLRQGERVQPDWMYKFLLNPGVIRPENHMVLRMPKFNMSPEEARALVNYFTATSKMTNPTLGVTAPYVQISQRDAAFWQEESARYARRVDPKQTAAEVERLKKEVADPKNKDKAAALKAQLDYAEKVEKFAKDQKTADAPKLAKDLYSQQAYKLLTNRTLCLQCHNIGSLTIEGPQGPNLALSAERLRPEWMEHWIAKPSRLFPYEPVMPQNFPNKADRLQWFDEQKPFVGSPLDQTRAVRDILLDQARLADLIATIPPPPPPKKEEKK